MPQQPGAKRAAKVAIRQRKLKARRKEANIINAARQAEQHDHDHDHEHGEHEHEHEKAGS